MKTKKAMLCAITLLLMVLFILPCGCMDDSTAQDDDLLVSRIEIPEAENAFTYFSQAVEKIYWPEDEEELIQNILDGEEWDSSFVAEFISKNEQSFNLLEEGLTYSNCQAPAPTIFPSLNIASCMRLAKLSSIKAAYLFKQDQEKEAFDETIQLIKIGYMMEGSQGDLICYLIGIAMKGIGLERLREMMVDTTLPSASLRSYVDKLGNLKADREGFAYAIKAEYTWMAKAIDDASTGKINLSGEEEATPSDKMCQVEYYFMPNKTKRLFAELYRPLTEDIFMPYGEREFPEPLLLDWSTPDIDSWPSRIKFFLSPNSAGEWLYVDIAPNLNFSQFASTMYADDFQVSGTQLLLAVKSYKSETGSLPQSLNELVPKYISKVPEDPYDGKFIRYLPEERIIYSVGEDLIDSGGSEEDLTFKIEF